MPTHHHGNPAETRALDAYIKLLRASETVHGKVHKELAPTLTQGQFAVLEALYHLGPMTQVEIGRKVLRSNANITTVVDNLERQDLLQRARQSDDRRCVTVSLTTAGQELMARVFPAHAQRVSQAFSVLTPAEQDELGRLCRKLGLGQG